MCFFKRQEREARYIKETNPEPALERQAHVGDFEDIFANKTQTQKVNMAENCIAGNFEESELTKQQLANSATKMN